MNIMKIISRIFAAAAIAALATSCFDLGNTNQNYKPIYSSIVTLKPQPDGTYFMKASDTVALAVLGEKNQQYPIKDGKEHKAIVSYTVGSAEDASGIKIPEAFNSFKTKVYATPVSIDTIVTQMPLQAAELGDYKPGTDGVEIYHTNTFPATIVEDGYLTVYFLMFISYDATYSKKHTVDLVLGSNPDDPYEVVFHHNANGDPYAGRQAYCLVNFPLKDLPDTHGETKTLTLKWTSISGKQENSIKFNYKTRTDW